VSETITTVEVRFTGMLARALGFGIHDTQTYHLSSPATYGDLLRRIGEEFADRFPPNTWNAAETNFHGHVTALHHGNRLDAPSDPLTDGAEVVFIIGIAGGAGAAS